MLLLILKVCMSYPMRGQVNDLLVYVKWSFKFWFSIFLILIDSSQLLQAICGIESVTNKWKHSVRLYQKSYRWGIYYQILTAAPHTDLELRYVTVWTSFSFNIKSLCIKILIVTKNLLTHLCKDFVIKIVWLYFLCIHVFCTSKAGIFIM
jgi:hypothetical protein